MFVTVMELVSVLMWRRCCDGDDGDNVAGDDFGVVVVVFSLLLMLLK